MKAKTIERIKLIREYILTDVVAQTLLSNYSKLARYIIDKEGIDVSEDALRKVVVTALQDFDIELIQSNVSYKKQTQRFQDVNRIERKSFREFARIENAVEEYQQELIKVLKEHSLSIPTIRHHVDDKKYIGVFHITDAHFNELVELKNNRYDFTIASQRYQKFVNEATRLFMAYNIKEVVVSMTGDLLNSDRRLDELLAMATNRSKATFLAVEILLNVILDLNKNFNITVASVTGNESRVNKDIGWNDLTASDSYDTTIHNILGYLLKDKEGVYVIPGCPLEQVIDINGQNVLLIHGHQLKQAQIHNTLAGKIKQYADQGVIINYVLFGHLHETYIGDLFARGSSPVGANDYSEKALGLTSRASQNIHIIGTKEIHSMKIDLQEVSNKGYDIKKELEAYNAKSASKASPGVTIFKVTI